ncbi:MAG: rhomboid family intramembrane serine protease [bacterium]|jgi:membrane associated rhomboid family serine protease
MPIRDNAPSYQVPWITLTLIVAIILAFVWQLTYPGGFEQSLLDWGEIPKRILAGENVPGTEIPAWTTMFTSMFMHGGLEHIFGNMIGLWLFGDNIEWLLGRFRFLMFYIVAGLLASVVTVYLGYESDAPGIGASGALAGVMAAYLIYYPRARITSIFLATPFSFWWFASEGQVGCIYRNMSAYWYIGSWVVLQVLLSTAFIGSGIHQNLGIYAHAAGALAGAGLAPLLAIRNRIPSADSFVRTDPLTTVIIGDEGDAGGGQARDVPTLEEEMERIRRESLDGADGPFIHGQTRPAGLERTKELHDFHFDELVEKGDYDSAFAHARDMIAIAKEQGDMLLVRAYEKELAKLRSEGHQEKSKWW